MAPKLAKPGNAFLRALVIFGPFELVLSAAMVATWFLTGLIELRAAIPIAAVRVVLWLGYLRASFAPVQACHRDPAGASDATVLAAHDGLERLVQQGPWLYSISWIGAELAWLGVSLAGLPGGVELGTAEMIAGVLFVSVALGLASLVRLLLEHHLMPLREELGGEIVGRKLEVQRAASSVVRPIVEAAIWLMLGGVVAVGGVAVVASANAERELAAVRVHAALEVNAALLEVGHEPRVVDDLEVEILTRDGLAPKLLAALDSSSGAPSGAPSVARGPRVGEVVTVVARREGRVEGAVALADGRYLVSSTPAEGRAWLMSAILALVAGVAVPLFGFGFNAFAATIATPLRRIADAADGFVERGEVQSLEAIVPLRNDELGRLATSFNAMLRILHDLAAAAAAVSDGNLRVDLDHPGELHDAFRGMLVRLNTIVSSLRETSLELASAAAEINALTQQQEQAAQTQAGGIQQLAATVTSLATSAQQIADAAKDVLHDAEHAVATTNATAEEIVALRAHTASVGELLQVIREIAERSDLLALNGSLEATRAGEAGRGFALVAAEMRRLAERVTGTVANVRTRIADIESSGAGTVAATEASRKLAERTAVAARDISTVTATQSSDTEQASLGVQSVADEVVRATLALSQIRAAAEGLGAYASELERQLAGFEVREDFTSHPGPSPKGGPIV